MNIQSFVQTQEKRRTCNLAQFGGATSICTEDGEESRDCNPDLCRKFRNATFPAHLLPSGASGLERLERLEQLLHLLRAGGEPWVYLLLQVRTRVQACDPAQHGGSSEACSEDQTESEDCSNSCCEWCTFKTLFKVKWMASGALGVRGPPARLAVPPGLRGGAGPAGTAAPPAGETRVVAPLINQGCATHLTAVSDHLRHTL